MAAAFMVGAELSIRALVTKGCRMARGAVWQKQKVRHSVKEIKSNSICCKQY